MKSLFVLASLLGSPYVAVAAPTASDAVICNINVSSSKPMVFDGILYSANIKAAKYLLLEKGAHSAREVQLNQFSTYAEWKAIDGSTIVTFSPTDDGRYGITVSHVDISRPDNMLPLDGIATGPVRKDQLLNLILPEKNLSLVCLRAK